uniref:NadR/Ttd14 AAA domain-containing protein n=2 Tax=Ciona intestinalis TaxID=7719 RepID=F6UXL6_CIOIN
MKSVLISGAHSTGKTTLLNHLQQVQPKKLSKTPLMFSPEVARKFMAESGFNTETQQCKQMMKKINFLILDKQYEREQEMEIKMKDLGYNEAICIYDRGVIDPICYLDMYVGEEAANKALSLSKVKEMITRMRDETQCIVFVIMPQEKFIEDDGIRVETSGIKELFNYDDIMTSYLDRMGVYYHRILEEDLFDRSEFVQ